MTAGRAFVVLSAGLLVTLAGLFAALGVAGSSAAWAGDEPPAARQRELLELLHQDCGACHGMRLTGGLGPPLTAAALRERPFESVVATIEHGRPGTPMPPWRRFLSDGEVRWLAGRLTSGTADAR